MKKIIGLLIILTTIFLGCRGTTTDDTAYSVDTTTESAQQVGDAMASVDESGGSTGGAITSNEIKSYEKAFSRRESKCTPECSGSECGIKCVRLYHDG